MALYKARGRDLFDNVFEKSQLCSICGMRRERFGAIHILCDAWRCEKNKISRVLGAQFAPYLPLVMSPLLRDAVADIRLTFQQADSADESE